MTPTKQSPETRARELAERLLNGWRDGDSMIALNELTTLITKADALDWSIINHTAFSKIVFNNLGGKLDEELTRILSAIIEAMKGRK